MPRGELKQSRCRSALSTHRLNSKRYHFTAGGRIQTFPILLSRVAFLNTPQFLSITSAAAFVHSNIQRGARGCLFCFQLLLSGESGKDANRACRASRPTGLTKW